MVACSPGAARTIAATSSFNVLTFKATDRRLAPVVAGESLRAGPPVALEPGVVTVVNFWGSWCGPCRREQPSLESLSKEYLARGVRFIGVNTRRDQRAAALAYLDEFNVTYPSIYDPDSTIASRFKVRFMPVTFVVDRTGRIAAQIIGAIADEASLRTVLDGEVVR